MVSGNSAPGSNHEKGVEGGLTSERKRDWGRVSQGAQRAQRQPGLAFVWQAGSPPSAAHQDGQHGGRRRLRAQVAAQHLDVAGDLGPSSRAACMAVVCRLAETSVEHLLPGLLHRGIPSLVMLISWLRSTSSASHQEPGF